jgi:outer membrane protein assembly factor BamB
MTRLHSLRLAATLLVVETLVVATTTLAAKPDPLDWPYWRGPEGNSISRETGLPDTVKIAGGEGSNLLWKAESGAGRSTPIVMNGKLYTLVRDKPGSKEEGEKVICFDAASGEVVWENKFNVWSSDVPDTRVGWSSVTGDPETGNVYALGVCGYFQCINGENGKTLWAIPMHERFGLLSTYGGRTNYPIVCDDLVILGAVITGWGDQAVPAHRLMGFDKATGDVRWVTSTRLRPPDTTHSAPTLCTIKGQKLLIAGSGDGWVYAFQPRTGKMVWEYRLSRRGINSSPTVVGETIFIGHSEENPTGTKMGSVVAIDGGYEGDVTQKGELWKAMEVGVGKSSVLAVDDKLYCPDDAGKLFVLNAKSGEQIGKKLSPGTMNFSTPIYADGKIYHMEKQGRLYIIDLRDAKAEAMLAAGRLPKPITFGNGVECWASPVVSHGRLYIQSTKGLYCFEDMAKEHGSTERPAEPQETDVAENAKPTQLQIIPADVLMRSGESQQFEVRLFNSKGQQLEKPAEVKFELTGDGKLDESGKFTSSDDAPQSAAYVTASIGEMKSKARIRIVPPLPWKFDFTGLTDAPITWVGARYRHIIRKVDGNDVLVKITTIPLGTKSRAWFGPTDMHDYTIRADFLSAKVDTNKIAAMGVIAQGYKFAIETPDVAGGGPGAMKLVINSWDAHDHRLRAVKPFVAAADTWYTLKLKVSNVDGKVVAQGKVWLAKKEKEPDAWTLELTDTRPTTHGAPGMHCNATDAEIFIDNVSVTANK